MAETKYELYTQPNKDMKIYNKPWWKERLKEKWIRSNDLDTKNWKFLNDNYGDGSNGEENCDGQSSSNFGLGPNIIGKNKTDVSTQSIPKRASKTNKKMSHVNQIEAQLMQHPLALYPHLEESLPAELFTEVMEILDPEMHRALDEDDFMDPEKLDDGCEEYEFQNGDYDEFNFTIAKDSKITKAPADIKSRSNPYRWVLKSEERNKKDKKKGVQESLRQGSPPEDDQVKEVTKEFCNWVASLGGDENNIEESTIASLFASGYETKPPLSVPIHVVEMANVPQELRMSTQISRQPSALEANSRIFSAKDNQTTQSSNKYKYGSWYLDPKIWKKRPANEPLQNPKESKDNEMSEAKVKSLNLDYDLAPMHGTKLFKEFVEKKETRRPEFLDHVAQILTEKQQEEQQNRLQSEKLKQKKQTKK